MEMHIEKTITDQVYKRQKLAPWLYQGDSPPLLLKGWYPSPVLELGWSHPLGRFEKLNSLPFYTTLVLFGNIFISFSFPWASETPRDPSSFYSSYSNLLTAPLSWELELPSCFSMLLFWTYLPRP